MPVTEFSGVEGRVGHTHQLPHSEQFPNWSSTQAHIIGEGLGLVLFIFHFPFYFYFLILYFILPTTHEPQDLDDYPFLWLVNIQVNEPIM